MTDQAPDRTPDSGQRAKLNLEHLTAREAADLIGVHERTIRRAIARGDLAAARTAGVYQIARSDLLTYRDKNHIPTPFPVHHVLNRPRLIESTEVSDHSAHPLPRPLTPLIGREREVEAATRLLQRVDVRLVTLTGAGGIGKTRLALAVGDELFDDFPNGVVWVPLASLQRMQQVVPAIAQAMGLRESGEQTHLESVKTALSDARMLLVLDNFEHLIEAAAEVAELLASTHSLKVLVTSRTLLRIAGESAFPVPPLAVPEPGEAQFPDQVNRAAVQLFVQRATSVVPEFTLNESNAEAVGEICRRLEGLPLGIELAAARSNLMPPSALLARLDRRLPLLVGGGRDLPERLRTMRGAIAWSYDLLSPEEQLVFRRLSCFAGGASLDALEHVCQAAGGVPDPLTVASSLVDRSLIQMVEEPPGYPRVMMLETVREYATELAQSDDDLDEVKRAHADFFLDLVARHDTLVSLNNQATALALLEADHANLRVALSWLWDNSSTETVALGTFCTHIFSFWWVRGHLQEGLDWINRVLTLPLSMEQRASLLRAASYFHVVRGEIELSESLAQGAIACAAAIGNEWIHAYSLLVLGWAAVVHGDLAGAKHNYMEGLAIARSVPDPLPFQVSTLLECLASVALQEGDLEQAEDRAREALTILDPHGERYGIGFVLRTLGWILYSKGHLTSALESWLKAFHASLEVEDPSQIADSLSAFGRVAIETGQIENSAKWLGAANAQRERAGRSYVEYNDQFQESIEISRTRLGQNRFSALWEEGSMLAPDKVRAEIERAGFDGLLAGPGKETVQTDTPTGPKLTPRESEILELLVAGKTDSAIASELFLSVRTVEHHVARILGKLDVRTRSAAVSTALRIGIVFPASPDVRRTPDNESK